MKTAALYLHNGLADWEVSFLLPELRKASYEIKTVAESMSPVTTMGGLRILPDHSLNDFHWAGVNIVILPGGDSWIDPALHLPMLRVLPELQEKKIAIAAICGATVALGRIGLLDKVSHTSNYLPLLKAAAPEYKGEALYVNELAVADGNLVTASGLGAIEFSFEILKLLKIYDEKKAHEWYELFKHAVIPQWLMG